MVLNIFKIEYYWYEEEHDEILLGKDIERKKFEKELGEAKNFARSLLGKKIVEGDYLGKGYSTECTPEYYEQIVWFLTERKGYIQCSFNEDVNYIVDDTDNGEDIQVNKYEKKIEESEL